MEDEKGGEDLDDDDNSNRRGLELEPVSFTHHPNTSTAKPVCATPRTRGRASCKLRDSVTSLRFLSNESVYSVCMLSTYKNFRFHPQTTRIHYTE